MRRLRIGDKLSIWMENGQPKFDPASKDLEAAKSEVKAWIAFVDSWIEGVEDRQASERKGKIAEARPGKRAVKPGKIAVRSLTKVQKAARSLGIDIEGKTDAELLADIRKWAESE